MSRSIMVIGVPFALGGETTGPERGPDTLIRYGLSEVLTEAGHRVTYERVGASSDGLASWNDLRVPHGRIHSEHALREMAALVSARVFSAHRTGRFPLVIGGDHSASIGSVTEYLDPALSLGRRVGLLWIDAHYDAHTDRTSRSHQANGMPLATALGRGRRVLGRYRVHDGERQRLRFLFELTLHIGAGTDDCEPEEEALLRRLCVPCVTMQEIQQSGSSAFLGPLARFLALVDDVIVSIDIDAIRRDHAPAVSFPSRAGLIPSQLMQIIRPLKESGKLRQLEIMEYNPEHEVLRPNGHPVTATLIFALLRELL